MIGPPREIGRLRRRRLEQASRLLDRFLLGAAALVTLVATAVWRANSAGDDSVEASGDLALRVAVLAGATLAVLVSSLCIRRVAWSETLALLAWVIGSTGGILLGRSADMANGPLAALSVVLSTGLLVRVAAATSMAVSTTPRASPS